MAQRSNRRPAGLSRPSAAVVLGAVLALGACSSDEDEPSGSDTPTAQPSAETPTETEATSQSTSAEDEAAILAVYEKYWDARIAAENGPDPDPDLFAGIALDTVVALHVGTATTYVEEGIVRTGEPRIYNTEVTIDGSTAHVTSCVDDSEWVGTKDGEPLPVNPDKPEVYPVVFDVHHLDGTWLMGTSIEPETEITC